MGSTSTMTNPTFNLDSRIYIFQLSVTQHHIPQDSVTTLQVIVPDLGSLNEP